MTDPTPHPRASMPARHWRDWLKRPTPATPSATPATPVSTPSAAAVIPMAVPRYPPLPEGLPVVTLAQLLESQRELIDALHHEIGLGYDDDGTPRWSTYVEPVLHRYAAFVHLIPASETHHHRGPGGLLRHGLEVAFRAMRLSHGLLIGRERPRAEQLQLEPRFWAAATLAGLLHDAGKVIGDVRVTDPDGRRTWEPLAGDLIDWAAGHGLAQYRVHWRDARERGAHESFNLMAVRCLVPPVLERWLLTPDRSLYVGFLATLTGVRHPSRLIELVRRADQSSVERDLKSQHPAPLPTTARVSIDGYLLDAMRRLLQEGRWQVNVPGARVWLLRDHGLHLVWPAAAKDLAALIAQEGVSGMPRDPDSLAEVLIERGLAVAAPDTVEEAGRHRTWRLAPAPLARDGGQPVSLYFLRLREPALLFPDQEPEPVAVLVAPSTDASARPAAPPVVSEPVAPSLAAASPAPAHAVTVEPDDDVGVADPQSTTRVAPAAAHEARSWLAARGDLGQRLLQPLALRDGFTAEDVRWQQGLVWLCFPDWFDRVGWPSTQAAEALSAEGLLEPDPSTPMRRVRDHAGRRWLVLSAEVSTLLSQLLDDPNAHDDPQPDLVEALIAQLRAEQSADAPSTCIRLGQVELKRLARAQGLGVYRLRDRLCSDPRVRLLDDKRLEVQL